MYFVGKTQYVVVWLRCLVIKNVNGMVKLGEQLLLSGMCW